jgi:lysyl-tRNA synthetase class 2
VPEELSYVDAFHRELGLDPLTADDAVLLTVAIEAGLARPSAATATRDELLDFLVATRVGPALGHGRLTCLHHYPASQASLARLDPVDARTALRFELYADGVELANGFVELGDPHEQARRFAADNERRRASGRETMAPDERLLAALARGLPACAGVALGFERLMMLASGAEAIDAVLALPDDAG